MRLNEVFLIGDKSSDYNYLLAYRDKVYILNDYNFDEYKKNIERIFGTTFESLDDVRDYYSEYSETNPKVASIVFGSITNDNYLFIDSYNQRHGKQSKTLQKALKAANLKGIVIPYYNIENDEEYIEDRVEFIKPIEREAFYHGTDSESVKQIAKTGIRPSNKTNFKKIKHDDKVFITLNPEKAIFHANHAAQKNSTFPVILKLKIPDPAKLVLDYDIAISLYGMKHPETIRLGYSEIQKSISNDYSGFISNPDIQKLTNKIRKNPNWLNTRLGVFGYIGRIPATFIKSVLFDMDLYKQYVIMKEMGDEIDYSQIERFGAWEELSLEQFIELENNILEDFYEEMREDDEDY